MAYPETYATMVNLISSKLQDASNAVFSDAEIELFIAEGLREISQYHPYIYRCEFNLESRVGTATSTLANNLVDATNDQFLSTDVGKWIYNSTDRTWAVVTAYVDETTLTLSKNIMASGESYQMFNQGCTDSKEININAPQAKPGALGTRAFDFLYIDKIEYPILQDPPSYLNPGQWELQENNIIRLKVGSEPPNTKASDAADEVWIYFTLQHSLSRLTGFLGKIDLGAGYAAGLTSIHVDDMTADEVIYKGQMFTVDSDSDTTITRGIYIADYQRTLTGGESDVTFFPPLTDAVTDNSTVRFIANTLDYKLEGVFADLVAGRAAISKARYYINRVNVGGGAVWQQLMAWGKDKVNSALEQLQSLHGTEMAYVDLP